MDKISHILDQLKERLTNPLFFAFIISWMFWNWEVTTALLWYDPTQIEKERYSSLFAFIKAHTSNRYSIFYPSMSAITYTTVGRLVITSLNDYVSKWSDILSLRILEGSSIPTEKYLEIKSKYESRTKELEIIIKNENQRFEQIIELQDSKIKLEKDNLELKQSLTNIELEQASKKDKFEQEKVQLLSKARKKEKELEDNYINLINSFTDRSVIEGVWRITYSSVDRVDVKYIEFVSDALAHLTSKSASIQGKDVEICQIIDLLQSNNRLLFVAEARAYETKKTYYYIDRIQGDHFHGFENDDRISMHKLEM